MNPHRLVAAVAALAIGFGVILVGVGIADDGSSAGPPNADQDIGEPEVAELGEGDGEPAEQQEEVAEEASPAEIEPAASQGAEQVETEQGPTSSTCSDLAESGASREDLLAEGCHSNETDDEVTGPRATCRAVYEITLRDGDQLFVVVKFVQDGSVSIEPDGEFVEVGVGGVERLDEVGFFFVDPSGDPILERPCDNVGEAVDLEELSDDDEQAGSDKSFPCDLPVGRVLDDLRLDGFIDLDGDEEESDWESYITLLDAALVQSSGDPSFDWGLQVASTADSAKFQDLDCGLAVEFWDEFVEASLAGARVDPEETVCFLVQFVALEQRSDGGVDNPFIDYLDNFGPALAGCPIFESMVL